MKHRQFARIGLLLLSTQLSVVAATYTVDRDDDNMKQYLCTSAPNDCTLSGALTIVASGDTIDFDLPAASVITLDTDLPSIDDKNLTIDGSAVSGMTISGDNTHHPFHINSDSNVTIQGLSIISGRGDSEGGAIHNEGNLTIVESTLSGNFDFEGKGGAIYNTSNATLHVVDSNITSNYSYEPSASSSGGAIHSQGNVTISGSRIMNNVSQFLGGGAISIESATLKVSNSTISDNTSYGSGGAINMEASTLELSNSTISGNKVNNGNGGAISMNASTGELSNATIPGNTSYGYGGAIFLSNSNLNVNSAIISSNVTNTFGGAITSFHSDLGITDSTLSGNMSASWGGAILAYSNSVHSLRIVNSTISGNTAYENGGGGIFSIYLNHLYLSHSTIVDNKVINAYNNYLGGGILLNTSGMTIKNSIISGNSTQYGKNDCHDYNSSSTLTSEGYNLVEAPDSTCSFGANDVIGAAPDIGSLADNGGATKTHAIIPTPGNIAWNTGICDDIDNNPILTDQRGEPRPELGGSDCDIGAFEFGVDTDSDGLDDLTEIAYGTNPTLADSDIDGLDDGDEVYKYKTDPLKADTDGDGANDGYEVDSGTDPLDPAEFPSVGISPIEFLFGETDGTADFLVKNNTNTSVTLSAPALKGADGVSPPTGFSIVSNNCGTALPSGQSCTIEVAYPTSTGTSSSAFLEMDNVNLTAFIHNYEGIREEATRRVPAVIGDIDIPSLQVGSTQDINWSIVGYDDHNYTSYIALFDCDGVAVGECGESYNSSQRFAQGLKLQPVSVEASTWSYKGQDMKKYNYSFNFTPSSAKNKIVIRFYYKSKMDSDLGHYSISTIIPGGLADDYYDDSGRKIASEITEP